MAEIITDNVTTSHTDPISNITVIIKGVVKTYKNHNMSLDTFPTVTNKSLAWPEVNWDSILSHDHCPTWEPINHIFFQVQILPPLIDDVVIMMMMLLTSLWEEIWIKVWMPHAKSGQ